MNLNEKWESSNHTMKTAYIKISLIQTFFSYFFCNSWKLKWQDFVIASKLRLIVYFQSLMENNNHFTCKHLHDCADCFILFYFFFSVYIFAMPSKVMMNRYMFTSIGRPALGKTVPEVSSTTWGCRRGRRNY